MLVSISFFLSDDYEYRAGIRNIIAGIINWKTFSRQACNSCSKQLHSSGPKSSLIVELRKCALGMVDWSCDVSLKQNMQVSVATLRVPTSWHPHTDRVRGDTNHPICIPIANERERGNGARALNRYKDGAQNKLHTPIRLASPNRSTDNVRPRWLFVSTKFRFGGHFDGSHRRTSNNYM